MMVAAEANRVFKRAQMNFFAAGVGAEKLDACGKQDRPRAFEQKLICNLCRDGADVMRTWLHSLLNTILGKVPGKTSRPDTATCMAVDADFSGIASAIGRRRTAGQRS